MFYCCFQTVKVHIACFLLLCMFKAWSPTWFVRYCTHQLILLCVSNKRSIHIPWVLEIALFTTFVFDYVHFSYPLVVVIYCSLSALNRVSKEFLCCCPVFQTLYKPCQFSFHPSYVSDLVVCLVHFILDPLPMCLSFLATFLTHPSSSLRCWCATSIKYHPTVLCGNTWKY